MKKLFLVSCMLFLVPGYAQEVDDIYWTVYDVDTIDEPTNNYYIDYTSRINRFHRGHYYVSYWSYYNPYWYSYYYPFYTSYYWWWGWYSPYNNWYSYYSYSHRPIYHYRHHHAHHKKSNPNKKQVLHKPKGVKKPVYTTYTKPRPVVKKYPTYTKPKSIKYNHVKSQPTRPTKNYPQYTKPKSIQGPVKITPPKKIQHVQKQNRKI